MINQDLVKELAAQAPDRAKPYAQTIVGAATTYWPANPRLFSWLLVAVGERETNWRNVRGADQHGCGLLQIDDRAWRVWCQHHDAFDPNQNIPEGEYILSLGMKWFPNSLRAAVASYNCGPGNVRRGLALVPPNPDAYTTGNNYGADVLARLDRLKPIDLVIPLATT